MRKILLLANPLFKSRGGWNLSRVVHAFEQAGVEAEVQETGPNRAAGAKAKNAVADGVDAVIVCGGDGTVFDTVQGLAGSQMPLGILPLGTGNVLAQNLKIPTKPLEAVRWLLAASPHSVPLGKITCYASGSERAWFFVMAAGMGLHAAMMQAARRDEKDRTGRMAYFAAGAKTLFFHPLQPFELEITDLKGEIFKRQVCEMIAVRVAELNLWRPGGNLDFPFLRLASVEGQSRWSLVRASIEALFLNAGKRDHPSSALSKARYEDVLRVVCRSNSRPTYGVPIAVEADGEILGASCATIEMAGLDVQLLSRPALKR